MWRNLWMTPYYVLYESSNAIKRLVNTAIIFTSMICFGLICVSVLILFMLLNDLILSYKKINLCLWISKSSEIYYILKLQSEILKKFIWLIIIPWRNSPLKTGACQPSARTLTCLKTEANDHPPTLGVTSV